MARATFFILLAATIAVYEATQAEKEGEKAQEETCALMVKVLDAVRGMPAAKLNLKVLKAGEENSWQIVCSRITDNDGEVHNLTLGTNFTEGIYKVEFDTKTYWKSVGLNPFHHVTDVVFEGSKLGHHHYTLAVLLSPYSFTTTAVVRSKHK
uniref:Transthyretin n=1 Tax=Erpetoichthys calabaricus TaxID=27687 RepID=A0A8C4RY66_ERPCA